MRCSSSATRRLRTRSSSPSPPDWTASCNRKTGISVLQKNRFGDAALSDVSNVEADGQVVEANSRKRLYSLGNRLWHTDASFQDPRGRYSMLAALVVPPVPADTEFADMRTVCGRPW